MPNTLKARLKKTWPWLPRLVRKVRFLFLKCINDRVFTLLTYFIHFKRFPQLRSPKRFTDKLQWMKVHGNMEVLYPYVDKLLVRSFVQEKLGEAVLVPVLGAWGDANDIPFESLPNSFALKASHGSGFNILVKDKQEIDLQEVKRIANGWLETDYFLLGREPQYKKCQRMIFCEKLLALHEKYYDYKVFCVNGTPKIVQVLGYGENHRIEGAHFSTEWERVRISRQDIFEIGEQLEKPKLFTQMIQSASKLAGDFPFVRVDFYITNNKLYFGELTFTPTNGMIHFIPDELDYSFCQELVPRAYL